MSKLSQAQQRKAWNAYRKANAAKYRAWARGWKSGMKLTFQEYNRKWDTEHAAAKAAAKKELAKGKLTHQEKTAVAKTALKVKAAVTK